MKSKLFLLIMLCSFGVNAQLTNSYKRIKKPTLKEKDIKDKVLVTFESVKASKIKSTKTKKTIFDLTEKAQDEIIAVYSKYEKTSKDFRNNLIAPLEKAEVKSIKIIDDNYLTISRKFELFITDEWAKENPANRIESIRINISLSSTDNVKFSKFNNYQTKYEYFDIGTLEKTKTRNFNLGLGLESNNSTSKSSFDSNGNQTSGISVGITPKFETSFGSTNSTKENIALRKRFIAQSGSLTSKRMSIYMEGAPLRNLNGPIDIGFDFESTGGAKTKWDIINFWVDNKKQPKLRPQFLMIPNIDKNLKAEVTIEWVYRKVVRKGNTSYEGDDIIQYYTYTKDLGSQTVFQDSDLKKRLYTLRYKQNRVYFLKNNRDHSARFRTQEEAIKFLNYILEKGINQVDGFALKSKHDDKLIPINDLKDIIIEGDNY